MSAKAAVALKPPLPRWIPKARAAKILGVSLRMVERREQAGYLEKKQLARLPTESTARVVYRSADVLALKAGKPNTYARAVSDDADDAGGPVYGPDDPDHFLRLGNGAGKPQPAAAPSTALAVRRAPVSEFEHFARLFATIQNARQPDPKPWLTLDEAAEFSGLTREWLLKEATSGEGSIAVRDMGGPVRGGRWRFLRADLGRAE